MFVDLKENFPCHKTDEMSVIHVHCEVKEPQTFCQIFSFLID